MRKRSKIMIMLFPLLLLGSNLVVGYPLATTTTLPPPKKAFDKEDVSQLSTMLSMPIYQDSNNKNLYYYVPFFRVLQHDQGAASPLLNTVKIDNVFKAHQAMNRMQSVEETVPEHLLNDPLVLSRRKDVLDAEERLKKREEKTLERIEKYEDLIFEAEAQKNKASIQNDQRLVDAYQKSIENYTNVIVNKRKELAECTAEYNKIKSDFDNYTKSVVENWRMRRLYATVTNLASAGISIDIIKYNTTASLVRAINDALDELKKSIGGSLTMNIYSGFTEKQISEIRTLRTKYWPEVQFALMPANDLQFIPLTQVEDGKGKPRENAMFKTIRGSGGYHGGTVNFDLTVDGALGLSTKLEPFVLPVGVSAVIKDRVEAVKGHVTCKYNNDFWMKGRADVTDGWLIFDNDISNNIRTDTNSNGNCEVVVEKGDYESVQFEALKKIEQNFEKHFFRKTYLTQAEARAYYNNAVDNLDYHSNKPRGQATWIKYLIPFVGKFLTVSTLSNTRQSYWHTSKYNTGNADQLSFSEKIDKAAVEAVRRDMPAIICLFYNAENNTYDRCTRVQEEKAEGSAVAMKKAATSPECINAETLYECMAKRTQKAIEFIPQKEEKVVDNLLYIGD